MGQAVCRRHPREFGDQKATASLVKNLNYTDPEVRWATAEALRMLDTEKYKGNSR